MSMKRLIESLLDRNMRGAILRGIDFSRADFWGAKFYKAIILDADFTEAALRGSDFTQANFTQATFKGANFRDVYFQDVDLFGADFSSAKNLDKAKWPKGYRLVKKE